MRRERGAVLPLLAGAMVVLIGVGGLALDLGHAYNVKSELQNVLDAAALSGAKVLTQTGSTEQARTAALATLNMTLTPGLSDLGLAPVVEFSETLVPFVAGAVDARYIRVRQEVINLDTWFAQVLPGVGDQLTLRGSAVAGPQPLDQACESTVPMLVCARDVLDDTNYGFSIDPVEEMLAGGSQSDRDVGSGNFQLLALGCSGGSCLRENLDGGYEGCVTVGESVITEPGVNVGPVFQGLNIRFGIESGPATGDPDVITEWRVDGGGANDFWYDEYHQRTISGNVDRIDGKKWRRVLPVPVGDCTGEDDGRNEVTVLGVKCFFLTRPADHDGQRTVNGQFVGDCETIGGRPAPVNNAASQPYKIILFKDSDSVDS